jgi:hypothetical protein
MPNLVYYNYEWAYWQLYHKVTFDGPNKLILINKGETAIDVKSDIYSAWKEWICNLGLVEHQDNPAYLQAITAIGGEPTPTGNIGSTFFLQNGWKIKPAPGSYRLLISGNLFAADGSNAYVAADVILGQPNNITINSNTSNIVDLINAGFGTSQSTWLDELHQIHGLRSGVPLVVDPTSRTALPAISQTITSAGGANDPVTITRD